VDVISWAYFRESEVALPVRLPPEPLVPLDFAVEVEETLFFAADFEAAADFEPVDFEAALGLEAEADLAAVDFEAVDFAAADFEAVPDFEAAIDFEPAVDFEPVPDFEPAVDFEPVADFEPVDFELVADFFAAEADFAAAVVFEPVADFFEPVPEEVDALMNFLTSSGFLRSAVPFTPRLFS
jgi:hypothetical protein